MSELEVTIRPALRLEAGEVMAVIEAAVEEFRPRLAPAIHAAYLDDIRRLTERWDESEVMVAEQAGRIAGTVVFYAHAERQGVGLPRGWAGFRMLAVHPQARNRGLGRRLTTWCLARARALKAPTLAIHTTPFMATARLLYERLGFERAPDYDIDVGHFDPAIAAAGGLKLLAYRFDTRG